MITYKKRPKAVVTGASGFLGRHVTYALTEAGFDVTGIGIGTLPIEESTRSKIAHYCSDIITKQSMLALIKGGVPPALIIHAAGGASVGGSFKDPVTDRKNTLETTEILLDAIAAAKIQTKLIFISSAAVYGEQVTQPIPETAACAPVSPYGEHKMLAERACIDMARTYGMELCIVRFFSLYGRFLRKQILWDIANQLRATPEKVRLGGFGNETRDFLHVSDATKLLLSVVALPLEKPLILNGGTGVSTDIKHLARSLSRAFGLDPHISFSGERFRGDPAHLVADVTRAKQLSFSPLFALQDGLDDYFVWFRDAQSRRDSV